jgi:molecular chaperone DnaK
VHVSAKDLGTGKEQSIRAVASSGLTEEEIERMRDEADEFRDQDKAKKEHAELLVNADGLVYSTEKSLEEFSDMLSAEDVEEIRDNLSACKDMLEQGASADFEELKQAVSRLETSAHRIADAMYSGASEEPSEE